MTTAPPTVEARARAVGASPRLLRRRLEEVIPLLVPRLRNRYFPAGHKPVFDFEARTLTGLHGGQLVWELRARPNAPVAYDNQQTSRGSVSFRCPPAP